MRLPLIAVAAIFLLMAACGGHTEPSANQLAYVDPDGDITLVNANGSGARELGDAERCGRFPRLTWSPTGHRLACIGSRAAGEGIEGFIVLVDADGETIADLKLPGAVVPFYWSPSGEAFLYGVDDGRGVDRPLFLADDSGRPLADLGSVDLSPAVAEPYQGLRLWSPDGRSFFYRPADATETRIYSLDPAGEQSLPGDYRALAWALDGKALLVAAHYQPSVGVGHPDYEANLFDLTSEELTRVPDLDNGRQLWISPDDMSAAVLLPRLEGSPRFAMLDFQSRQLTPIPDSLIAYGSDSIPGSRLTFSADGSELYWLTAAGRGTEIYRANADGTGLTKTVELETPGVQFSPDLTLIAYYVYDDDRDTVTLYMANIDGTGVREIARAPTGTEGFAFASAWRPAP